MRSGQPTTHRLHRRLHRRLHHHHHRSTHRLHHRRWRCHPGRQTQRLTGWLQLRRKTASRRGPSGHPHHRGRDCHPIRHRGCGCHPGHHHHQQRPRCCPCPSHLGERRTCRRLMGHRSTRCRHHSSRQWIRRR